MLRRQLENPLATELLEERFRGAEGVRVILGSETEGLVLRFEPQVA